MRSMNFYTADRGIWSRNKKGEIKNGLLAIHAAVRAADPAHDDLFRPEIFQGTAGLHQRGLRIPVDHVHEKSGNMEAGAYGLRAVLVLLRLDLSAVPILFVIGRSAETIGYVGLITVFLQLVPMLCALPVTEHALRKKFDKNGMRKS